VRGALAGTAATWVMDLVTTAMYGGQSVESRAREEAVRPKGQGPTANLVDKLGETFDVDITPETKSSLDKALHYALGALPGALYGALRHRLPLVAAGGGLVYGLLLWAVNDELLNTQLELAAAPDAYPPEAHLRGLVGHVVLGALTDSGVDFLGG
jgi:hypothetical protein